MRTLDEHIACICDYNQCDLSVIPLYNTQILMIIFYCLSLRCSFGVVVVPIGSLTLSSTLFLFCRFCSLVGYFAITLFLFYSIWHFTSNLKFFSILILAIRLLSTSILPPTEIQVDLFDWRIGISLFVVDGISSWNNTNGVIL